MPHVLIRRTWGTPGICDPKSLCKMHRKIQRCKKIQRCSLRVLVFGIQAPGKRGGPGGPFEFLWARDKSVAATETSNSAVPGLSNVHRIALRRVVYGEHSPLSQVPTNLFCT